MATPERRFVSRGGEKLEAALTKFPVRVEGVRALDAGASTGGFTDCLLIHGAASVVAVDVAYGQFDWRLRNDPRVMLLERTNVRHLAVSEIGELAQLITADLAFIGLRQVADSLTGLAASDAQAILLVKPQFELPRARVPNGGVVSDPVAWREALEIVTDAYRALGWALLGACASPMVGPKGNREFLVWLARDVDEPDDADAMLDVAVAEAP